ncbi:MAG: HAD family hydrolase [Chloroflexi bacterium]|nr:HAD family hydrolase [Chloroflexota bacterium]MDA1270786.1 HAD family hydrolase [Chloroflexota bacterium]
MVNSLANNGRPPILAATLDLDGTIIGANELISPAVYDAIIRLAVRVPVFISTGREPADVLRYSKELGLTTPQVSDGGANILDPVREVSVWTAPLGPVNAKMVVTKIREIGVAFVATHANGTASTFDDVPGWDLIRVSALDMDEGTADSLARDFQGNANMYVTKALLPYNGLWAVDFTLAGVDKATGVARVGKTLGVDPANMVAAGDSYNDLPMLRVCGFTIAMGNAPDEVKAIADFVAPSAEEDGLAVAINDYILPLL